MKLIKRTVFCIILTLLNCSFAAKTDGCGELTLKLTGGTEEIEFPRGTTKFSTETDCTIQVSAPEKSGINMTIPKIDIPQNVRDCDWGYVQASHESNNWQGVQKHCEQKRVDDPIKSDGDLFVKIVILNVNKMPSFTLKFSSEPTKAQKAAGCGNLDVALTGGMQDFTYPMGGKFTDYTDCIITFTPPGDSKVNMTIPVIKIPGTTTDCENGYVQASDKSDNWDKVGKHCKDTPVLTPITSNGKMFVKIIIKKALDDPSFTLRFMSDPTPTQKAAGCGNLDVALTNGEQEFTYPMGGKFTDYTQCTITFTPPANSKVSMTIPTIKIPQTASECDNGFVQASNKTEELDMAPKHCQTTPVETPITSDGKMFVKVTIKDVSKDPSFTLKFVSGASKFMTCPFMVVLLTSFTSVLGFLV